MSSAQLDFFGVSPRRTTFRDESWPYGLAVPVTQAGREAMAKVLRNAGDLFKERAAYFILEFLQRDGEQSGEELTDKCKARGLVPHDDRAFGPVLASLSRRGLIEKAGFCPRSKGHGTAGGNIWKAK